MNLIGFGCTGFLNALRISHQTKALTSGLGRIPPPPPPKSILIGVFFIVFLSCFLIIFIIKSPWLTWRWNTRRNTGITRRRGEDDNFILMSWEMMLVCPWSQDSRHEENEGCDEKWMASSVLSFGLGYHNLFKSNCRALLSSVNWGLSLFAKLWQSRRLKKHKIVIRCLEKVVIFILQYRLHFLGLTFVVSS